MSSSNISVRPMVSDDCAGVVELIRSCYGDSYGVEYFYHVDVLLSKLEGGRLHSVIALKERQIIGHMALLQRHMSDAAEPDFQPNLANEAASRLLEFIREDAHAIGVPGPACVPLRRAK